VIYCLSFPFLSRDIKWFYKISKTGLCINRSEVHKIIEDPNMPNNVKRQIQEVFMR
jgi:hypothetical protein